MRLAGCMAGGVRRKTGKEAPTKAMHIDIWGLSNIPLSRIGGLRRACAELARACARAVWLKMVFGQSHHADTLRWLILL